MRKLLILSLLLIAGISSSCDKSDDPIIDTNSQSLVVELRNFETGEYKIGDAATNETISFVEQPMHAETNNLFRDEDGQVFYTYKANDGYTGIDYVSFEKTSRIEGDVTVEGTLEIRFRVTN